MDTMIVRSALGYPLHFYGQILEAWYDGKYDLVWTSETIDEYRRVLLESNYLAEFNHQSRVEEFLLLLEWYGVCAPEVEIVDLPWIRDEHDRKWEHAAIAADAGWLITVDNDFLQDPDLIRGLRLFGVRVVSPAIFWMELNRP
jgi:putative PIN family toxin of toxin-antitoxin system